jgi:hypothetical protein
MKEIMKSLQKFYALSFGKAEKAVDDYWQE